MLLQHMLPPSLRRLNAVDAFFTPEPPLPPLATPRGALAVTVAVVAWPAA
jgi:hypothetical protein